MLVEVASGPLVEGMLLVVPLVKGLVFEERSTSTRALRAEVSSSRSGTSSRRGGLGHFFQPTIVRNL
jgi:hypothetical protein